MIAPMIEKIKDFFVRIFRKREKTYVGHITEEVLVDNRILNDLKILSIKITDGINSLDRRHVYVLSCTRAEIERLANNIKDTDRSSYFFARRGRGYVISHGGNMLPVNEIDTKQDAVEEVMEEIQAIQEVKTINDEIKEVERKEEEIKEEDKSTEAWSWDC